MIRRGRVAKVAIERAPGGERVALPKPQALDRPLERVEVAVPKELSYLDEED